MSDEKPDKFDYPWCPCTTCAKRHGWDVDVGYMFVNGGEAADRPGGNALAEKAIEYVKYEYDDDAIEQLFKAQLGLTMLHPITDEKCENGKYQCNLVLLPTTMRPYKIGLHQFNSEWRDTAQKALTCARAQCLLWFGYCLHAYRLDEAAMKFDYKKAYKEPTSAAERQRAFKNFNARHAPQAKIFDERARKAQKMWEDRMKKASDD